MSKVGLRCTTGAFAALIAGAVTGGFPPPAGAAHDSAERICERGDPSAYSYHFERSEPIKVNNRRIGRLVLTYRTIGAPRFKLCAVALLKSHKRKRRMTVSIGFADRPWRQHKERGRFRRYAGPVYRGGLYRRHRGRLIHAYVKLGNTYRAGFLNPIVG